MWIRNFRRFIAEAFSGMVKNGLMTVASVIVVTSCLFIFGVFMTVTLNINHIGETLANSCQVQVFITKDAKYGGMIQSISDQIKKIDHLEDISYESGEETFRKYKEGLTASERKAFSGLPKDVVSDSFLITLDDISYTEDFAKQVKHIDGVESVENRQDMVNIINELTGLIRRVSFWIVIVFMLISIFIISNTVKLTVHNRRKEINIMKYVGATDSYIRWPFVIEGMIVGIISAVIAFVVTQSCYLGITNAMNTSMSSVSITIDILKFSSIWQTIVCSYLALGVAIGAMGSAFSIRRYLKV